MKKAKKILITTEEHEFLFVRRETKERLYRFCENCGAPVEMATLDEAVTESGATAREIIRQTETGAIHSMETENGHLLICLSSLERFC
jgi:hypothetical protein